MDKTDFSSEEDNAKKREYEPGDLGLVLSNAFAECGIRTSLDKNTHGQRVTLSSKVAKQPVDGEKISVSAVNILSYVNYALGISVSPKKDFKGIIYNTKIEAIAKWLMISRGIGDNGSEENNYTQLLNYLKNPTEKPNMKSALQNLLNTSWWLYCYHDEEFSGKRWEGVLRLLVEIHSADDVTIYHYDDFFPEEGNIKLTFCSYKGRVDMHNGGDRRYIFELKHNGERDLHILLHKGEGGNSAWLTGQYHNVSRRGNIISGKILFNNIGTPGQVKEEDKAVFFTKEYKTISKEYPETSHIRGFEALPVSVKETFARKTQSFISVRNCFNSKQIDEWNREENNQYLNEAEVSEYEYEFFISGPATLLPPDEYEKFREQVLQLKAKLEEWYDCQGKVFTLFQEETVVDYSNIESRSKLLFEKLVRSLRKSRVFIMLYHDLLVNGDSSRLTGMLIEFGYCFHERKDCLVLWDAKHETHLPNFIKGAAESNNSRIHLERFNSDKGENPLEGPLNQKIWRDYLSFYGR